MRLRGLIARLPWVRALAALRVENANLRAHHESRTAELHLVQAELAEARKSIFNWESEYARVSAELDGVRRDRDHAQAALARVDTENARLRTECDTWQQQYRDLAKDGAKARESVADFFSQIRYGIKIFDHTPVVPAQSKENFQPIPKERVQRSTVEAADRQFQAQIDAYYARKAEEVKKSKEPPASS